MIVAFTGSRRGMTEAQAASVIRLLRRMLSKQKQGDAFWHGDEAHADTEAAFSARDLGYTVVAWPGPDPETRGDAPNDDVMPEMPYLDRNYQMAIGCSVLIATPHSAGEMLRSGTWATVRYARQAGKTVYIVQPDGRIDREWQQSRPGSLVDRYLEHDIDPRRIR